MRKSAKINQAVGEEQKINQIEAVVPTIKTDESLELVEDLMIIDLKTINGYSAECKQGEYFFVLLR